MSDVAIRVEGLSKRYRIGAPERRYQTLRDHLAGGFGMFRNNRNGNGNTVWALKDIAFEVARGEVLGIIGSNGAGKTTLLKVLSRITEPTEGRALINGRVASLLEVGTGFHPELTGRENIYMNAAILGMRRAEIDQRFDEIVEFAEVSRFIDTPVKRYSSGMYLRLAFAVAAHLEPEILVVDEVLAVGDAAFQKKCLGKMGSVAGGGRTVMFVSHNMPAVSGLCDRAIWLEGGRLKQEGPTSAVVSSYLSSWYERNVVDLERRADRTGNGRMRFSRIWLTNKAGAPVDSLALGEEATFMVEYAVRPGDSLRNLFAAVVVVDVFGQVVLTLSTRFTGQDFDNLSGRGVISCHVPELPLTPDIYTVNLWSSNVELVDCVDSAFLFTVTPSDFYGTGAEIKRKHGAFVVEHSWKHL